MNCKKVMIVGLILTGVAFLAGCIFGGDQSGVDITSSQKTVATVETIFPLSYTNDDYQFMLRLPASWEGYSVEKRGLFAGVGEKDIDSYDFSHGGEVIFNISVHPKAQWEQMAQEEGPKPQYLGENEQYTFGYTYSQDGSFEASKRWDEVPLIIQTFQKN